MLTDATRPRSSPKAPGGAEETARSTSLPGTTPSVRSAGTNSMATSRSLGASVRSMVMRSSPGVTMCPSSAVAATTCPVNGLLIRREVSSSWTTSATAWPRCTVSSGWTNIDRTIPAYGLCSCAVPPGWVSRPVADTVIGIRPTKAHAVTAATMMSTTNVAIHPRGEASRVGESSSSGSRIRWSALYRNFIVHHRLLPRTSSPTLPSVR